ncbi:MAG: DUF1559 domain-containing protein [Planctomycetes bacterium]|nr:DUF1559 domain-containing protein [Planctomycetota bacterium]
MLAILPEIERGQLYNAYNSDLAAWESCNKTVVEKLVEVYLCPSEPRPDRPFAILMSGVQVEMAYSSYVGNLGSNYIVDYYDYGPNMQPDGLLFRHSRVKMRDIGDGTSQTLMAGERVHPDELLRPAWAFGVTGKVVGDTSTEILQPNDWQVAWGFSSYHSPGAHFVMADGSVGMISRQVDSNVFRGLSTRAGNEGGVERPF